MDAPVATAVGTTADTSYSPRRRDRRQGFADLLAALARGISQGDHGESLRGIFEQVLGRVVGVRVYLRDRGSRWVAPIDAGAESIALEVPGKGVMPAGVLEARLAPGCRLGDWEFQFLGAASQLAALVLELERARAEVARAGLPLGPPPRQDGAAPLIGSTMAMSSLRSTIERVARTDFTVLLEGESGVGKELVARQIHELSHRRTGPFVAINCAAIVETLVEAELFGIEERTATGVRGRRGKFEHADGGTLFLDEVSDLSPSAQAKLLRALQDLAVERVGGHGTHRVNIRIIAATNRGLLDLVERGLFRADLYYRLSGMDVRVPALRERRADVLELAQYFLERHRCARLLRLSPRAAQALVMHEWPGNVRELERLMERAVALAETDTIELDDLPATVCGDYRSVLDPSLIRNDTMRAWGARYARLVLDRCQGNKREASRRLGISYHTLRAYLRYPLEHAGPGGLADGVEREEACRAI